MDLGQHLSSQFAAGHELFKALSACTAKVVAATGAAWHGVRQSHEPRPVRRSQRADLVPNANNVNAADHPHDEGWHTASEDEDDHLPNHFLPEQAWQGPSVEQGHFQPLFQPSFSQLPDGSSPETMHRFQQPSHMPQMLQMPQMQQMVPVVMVPVPMCAESRAGTPQPVGQSETSAGAAHLPGPVSPGRLDRNSSSALSEVSDWASVEQASMSSTSSSMQRAPRWTNRDCDWAIRQLSSNPSRELLQQILQDAWVLASSKHGTRVVQAAMDVAEAPDKQLLTNVFKGRVWYALKSPHANHVLQKIIALMPPDKMQFVFEDSRLFNTTRLPALPPNREATR